MLAVRDIATSTLTIVSPIPRLKIPAKGARGRSLYPEDIQIGSAHPNKSEKWLKEVEDIKESQLFICIKNMQYRNKQWRK